jgi:hypothetical protein
MSSRQTSKNQKFKLEGLKGPRRAIRCAVTKALRQSVKALDDLIDANASSKNVFVHVSFFFIFFFKSLMMIGFKLSFQT